MEFDFRMLEEGILIIGIQSISFKWKILLIHKYTHTLSLSNSFIYKYLWEMTFIELHLLDMKYVWRENSNEKERPTQLEFLKHVAVDVLDARGVCKEGVDRIDIFEPSLKLN